MLALLSFVLAVLTSPFKSKSQLEAENAALRHQLILLQRKVRGRVTLTNSDRWFLVQLYRWFPSILQVLTIMQPETIVRWHRAGFRSYWRWKSRRRGGRPQVEPDLRALIRRMSIDNPLWARHVSTANRSSSGLRSRSQALPSTWSSDVGHPVRDGARFCGTTRRTLPPWICSSFRPLAWICCMPSSSSVWVAETWCGSTSPQTRRLNGSHAS